MDVTRSGRGIDMPAGFIPLSPRTADLAKRVLLTAERNLEQYMGRCQDFSRIFGARCEHLKAGFRNGSREPSSVNSPYSNFAMIQCMFVRSSILNMFDTQTFSLEALHDHLENLTGLLDMLLKRKQLEGAHTLLNGILEILLAFGSLLFEMDEQLSVERTEWANVIAMFETFREVVRERIILFQEIQLPQKADVDIQKFRGGGLTGRVHEAKCNGQDILIKFDSCPENAEYSMAAICLLRSPFIVNFLFAMPSGLANTYLYFMPDDKSFDLCDISYGVPQVSRAFLQTIACQLILGVDYLHRMGVIHRDITPTNIIMNQQCRIKIIDFHTATLCPGKFIPIRNLPYYDAAHCVSFHLAHTVTHGFAAPELMQELGADHPGFGRGMDWFSVGMTLYWLQTQRRLFEGPANHEQIMHALENLDFSHSRLGTPPDPTVPPFIMNFLQRHPRDRYGIRVRASEIRQDDFFTGCPWDEWAAGNKTDNIGAVNIAFEYCRSLGANASHLPDVQFPPFIQGNLVAHKAFIFKNEAGVNDSPDAMADQTEQAVLNRFMLFPQQLHGRLQNSLDGLATAPDWSDV